MKFCVKCSRAMNKIRFSDKTITYECPKCWTRIAFDPDGIYHRLYYPYHQNPWKKLTKEELNAFNRGTWSVS